MDDRPDIDIADPLERAKSRIDADAFAPVTLAELAATASLSPFHFSRAFAARFGASPVTYARDMRLQAAARCLAADADVSLIDLAFDCGFESQEGFTRAFVRAFGVPPGRYRSLAARIRETTPMTTVLDHPPLSQSGPVKKPALRIAGISQVFDEESKAGIAALWSRLLATPSLKGYRLGRTFGVCLAPPEGESCALTYLAGVELAADAEVPEGLELVEMPARPYLVFRQVLQGPDLHPQMQAAMREIWGERVPRAGVKLAQAPDLEVYPEGFDPAAPGAWVEWWLPAEA
jgi:AraC family transcriptional regulator